VRSFGTETSSVFKPADSEVRSPHCNFFFKQTSSFVSASWLVSLQVLGGGFQSVAKNANTNGGATTAVPKLSVSVSLFVSLSVLSEVQGNSVVMEALLMRMCVGSRRRERWRR
jgi:hypothetical protein